MKQMRAITGIDFHIAVTLLFRSWGIIAGGLTVLLVPWMLSAQQQGYYFTFSSLIALQIFFELGLNQVVMQTTGYAFAHLEPDDHGCLIGPAIHLDRLSSIVKVLPRWYLKVALCFAILVGIVGIAFFVRQGELPVSQWVGAWVLLVVASALNLYLSPVLAVHEGCNQVGQVARLRLYLSMIGYSAMWLALAAGFHLWAMTIPPVVTSVGTAIWLRRKKCLSRWLADREISDDANPISWRKDIFPLQWRIALSWVSGYLIFQLFTPAIFAHQGAAEAGRFGLALAIFTAIQSVGMSWVYSKGAAFAGYIARREGAELNRQFMLVLCPSIFFTALASSVLMVLVYALTDIYPALTQRISPIPVLAFLALVTLANSFIFSAATYLRAHKEEPMMWPSIVLALIVLGGVHYTAPIGTLYTAAMYFVATAAIALPWTIIIFRRYYKAK